MICPTCHHHRPAGHGQPIAPVCAWSPAPDQLDQLRAILPAPMFSRAIVQTAPNAVEACGAYLEIQR